MKHRISFKSILALFLVSIFFVAALAACQPDLPSDGTESTEQTTQGTDTESTDPGQTPGTDDPGNGDELLKPDDPTYEVAKVFKNVLISAVYGTGQNKDAAVGHGFIQLYNTGSESVPLAGAALYDR